MGDKGRVFAINHTSFDELTDEALYFIGLLSADGCIREDKHVLRIEVQNQDVEIIEKLRMFLGSNRRLYSYGTTTILDVASKPITQRLINLGVTQNKTFTLKVSDELVLSPHFWRGVLDGDGHLIWHMDGKYKRYGITLVSASKDFIEQFLNFAEAYSYRPRIETLGNAYRVTIQGKRSLPLIEILYKNATISLDRKRLRAQATLETFQ